MALPNSTVERLGFTEFLELDQMSVLAMLNYSVVKAMNYYWLLP